MRRLKSLKKIIGEGSGNFNKRLSGTLSSPMTTSSPAVPLVVQIGDVGDRTINVALLSIFRGFLNVDPDQHLSQFLIACITNNGRIEDIWLRWLPTTLKDMAFE